MAEETSTTETKTVKSSGSVKISVEEYNDLVARANEPKVVTPHYTTVEKTAEIQARDLVHLGAFFMAGGASMFIIGAISFASGRSKLKAL